MNTPRGKSRKIPDGAKRLLILVGLKLGFVALVTVATLYFVLGR